LNYSGENKDLLRFLTAGSVDDGKSTLIGRLLYESDNVYEDQLDSVRKASNDRNGPLDLSLLTDGLRAEREQAITIDVAYRYFSTRKRKFIIADTPGHEQYTRNMVTGASTADLAVVLVDARKGILEQTRRHAYIIWLLGIHRIVLAVNKMDLVNYDVNIFIQIKEAFGQSIKAMSGLETYSVPLSALTGENVTWKSERIPWYSGPTLLQLLENIPIEEDRNFTDLRFPVQSVIRPNPDFRGYAGQIVSGIMKQGTEVIALPSGCRTRIDQIILHKKSLVEAFPPQSVVVTLKDHIDLGRGDILADPERPPICATRFNAELIWMSERPLKTGVPYLIKHTSQLLCGSVVEVHHKVEMDSFGPMPADTLCMNEIGQVAIETHKPMFVDLYPSNRAMGSFIVIDPSTSDTVAAGILREHNGWGQEWMPFEMPSLASSQSQGLVVWLTGLSGAGKTTICNAVSVELLAQGFRVEVLDGDVIRRQLNNDLSFSQKDRDENVRRIGFVAQLLARHGIIVLVAAIAPYRAVREELRRSIPSFIEVYVNAPLKVCEQRDPKGLYRRVRQQELGGFTGVDDPYEPPLSPEVECHTELETVKASASKVITAVEEFISSRSVQRASTKSAAPALLTREDLAANLLR
jgi:bifunctional enzyme CysN/CysC